MESQLVKPPAVTREEKKWYRLYKLLSLMLSLIFAIVGLIFLFIPNSVLIFFNSISQHLGLPTSSGEGINFYLILAVGYMYMVTLLAYLMYRHPENKYFLWLLLNAKTVSSVLSICLYIFHRPLLIYMTNAIVDGSIATLLFLFYLQQGKIRHEYPLKNN